MAGVAPAPTPQNQAPASPSARTNPLKMQQYDMTLSRELQSEPLYNCMPISEDKIKGTNALCCGRRLIMGGDRTYLYSSVLLMTIPTLCFVIRCFTADRVSPAVGVVPLLLYVVMTFSFFAAACLDPGIIPRDTTPRETNPDTVITVDGVMFKWCRTCHIYRPPRAKHCPVCDNCVDRFDHHCPWVGTCIGRRNYRFFFTFVNITFVNAAYVMGMSVYFLFTEYDSVGDAVKDWAILVALVISFIALPLVGSLAGYHFYLVISNQTTNEDLNEVYAKEPNPFTLGRWKNFWLILCARQRPSRLVKAKRKGGKPEKAWEGNELNDISSAPEPSPVNSAAGPDRGCGDMNRGCQTNQAGVAP